MKSEGPKSAYNLMIVPAAPKVIGRLKSWHHWQWCYMGTSSTVRESIQNALGAERRHYYAGELDDVAVGMRSAFLDWIGQVGKTRDLSTWWATNTAYKNPLISDLFLECCFLALIGKWIASNVMNRVVILDAPEMIIACKENFSEEKIYVAPCRTFIIRKMVAQRLLLFARAVFHLSRALGLWAANKVISAHHPDAAARLKSPLDVLTSTWVEGRSFRKDGSFYDPYLGTLNDFIAERRFSVCTVSLPLIPIHLMRQAYRSGKVIPGMFFLSLADIFSSAFKAWRLCIDEAAPRLCDIDLTVLFRFEILRDKINACSALLHYHAIRNMLQREKVQCKHLLYPFENQPWDKMMIMAVREAGSPCRIIGCQHTVAPFFLLNFYLGKGEADVHPQPDTIVSSGTHWASVVKNAGFTCSVENGGSMRYGAPAKARSTATDGAKRYQSVLVLLSHSLSYSLDLLFYLIRNNNSDRSYLVKPHPDTPETVLRKYIKEFPSNFTFVDGPMEDWIGKVGWAIHVGTTAAIECMMNDVQVIKYLPERIDLDPLTDLPIEQAVATDAVAPDFESKIHYDLPDAGLIGEPFNRSAWENIFG